MEFQVSDWVILMFGTATKADRDTIKLRATTTQGIFFEASCPALVIDRKAKAPLTLSHLETLMEAASRPVDYAHLEATYGLTARRLTDVRLNLAAMRAEVTEMSGRLATNFERRFIELFFEHLLKQHQFNERYGGDDAQRLSNSLFNTLMPIPQAQFYCHDPLEEHAFTPENNFRVDFAFWTGTKFIAVEIDGNEPDGYAADVRRDRLLRRAGVDLVHILNTEIMQHGDKIISALLPAEILQTKRGIHCSPPFSLPGAGGIV